MSEKNMQYLVLFVLAIIGWLLYNNKKESHQEAGKLQKKANEARQKAEAEVKKANVARQKAKVALQKAEIETKKVNKSMKDIKSSHREFVTKTRRANIARNKVEAERKKKCDDRYFIWNDGECNNAKCIPGYIMDNNVCKDIFPYTDKKLIPSNIVTKSISDCGLDMSRLSKNECELTSKQYGTSFRELNKSQYAPGCFNHGNDFYYNTHPTGSFGNDGPIWCKSV